jgi:hypothetical protein
MNIEQANGIAMTEILQKIGCQPVRQKGEEIWYFSPFREEKTASFKVHTGKNLWYDFGEGKGGDVVKFACDYLVSGKEGSAVSAALKWLQAFDAFTPVAKYYPKRQYQDSVPAFTVISSGNIQDEILHDYIVNRGITIDLAQKFLKEIVVRHEKVGDLRVLGFANEANGYEFFTKSFKGSTGAKSISFIRGTDAQASEIHLFEAPVDFLSAMQQYPKQLSKSDVIVLNSVKCKIQAVPFIKNCKTYRKVKSWFDNDKAGDKATEFFKNLTDSEGMEFEPMNEFYKPFKDVNDWHVEMLQIENTPKPALKPERGINDVKP